jgi:hypothetical protein
MVDLRKQKDVSKSEWPKTQKKFFDFYQIKSTGVPNPYAVLDNTKRVQTLHYTTNREQ